MFKNLKIRTKILLAFAAVAVIAVGTIALVAFSIGSLDIGTRILQ